MNALLTYTPDAICALTAAALAVAAYVSDERARAARTAQVAA